MVPAAFDPSTVSAAERKIFELLRRDPATADWTVLHSLGLSRRGKKPYGEVDFVVLIPRGGVFCLEVKGGRIACRAGEWETTDRHDQTERLGRSPFLQARECMFAVRDFVLTHAPLGFPAGVAYGYAVVMPDVSFREQSTEWEPWQAIDRESMSRSITLPLLKLAAEQRKLFRDVSPIEPSPATVRTIRQLLRPDFEVVISRGATIEDTEAQLLRLTEEQFDALDLLADNERCLFEGAAGTGKTMLALEYARRASKAGRRTLFVCFNRLLGEWLARQASDPQQGALTTGSYFKLLRDVIVRSSIVAEFLAEEARGQTAELYERTYSTCGRLAIEELNDPYDVLVVDEAQDLLQEGMLEALDVWLKGGLARGHWAIFGDFQRQAIFGRAKGEELRAILSRFAPQCVKGRLTFNCRNTRNIGEETALLSGFSSPPYRLGQVSGAPVDYHYYKSSDSQCALLTDQIRRLLEGGVKPADIVVLSRFRLANSGLANVQGGTIFRLTDVQDHAPSGSRTPIIRFATAHAFKGMESPVIILCDIEHVGDDEPQALLYVAMSRARSLLTVMVRDELRGAVADCVRRKLQEGWGSKQ